MGLFGMFKKKPKVASMAEAMEMANEARRKIEKRREDAQKLRGVPLFEIEQAFSQQRFVTTDYEENTLVICHDPFTTHINVVAPAIAFQNEKVAALIQITTQLEKPYDHYVSNDETINALNAYASAGALIRAKDGRLLIGSRFTWFTENNNWQDTIKPLIIEAIQHACRSIILSEKNQRDAMPPKFSGISAWRDRDFVMFREMLPTSMHCTIDDMGLYAELPLPIENKTALMRIDKGPVNPYLGPGLQVRLNLPNHFETQEECLSIANWLNRRELSSVIAAWHYGAWYARSNHRLSYISFFPNSLWDRSDLITQCLCLMQSRVDWVTRALQECQYKE